jgi:hypothetical protein
VASMRDMGARLGMLVVETIAKIRRAFFVQKKPIKAICREFRVSRKVVRKVIRSEATEFRYERGRQPLPRIDPWREQLDGLLLANEGKPARERLTPRGSGARASSLRKLIPPRLPTSSVAKCASRAKACTSISSCGPNCVDWILGTYINTLGIACCAGSVAIS